MHAVIRRYHLEPRNHQAVLKAVEEGLVPKVASAAGFISYRAGFAGNGDAVSVSMFDTAVQADASSAAALDWVRQTLAPLLPDPPQVWRGEVRVRQLGAEPLNAGVIRRYNLDAANVDEVVRRAETGFVPIISKTPGFANYAIIDTGGGQVITLSGFRDRATAEASVTLAADWVKANLAPLMPYPPEITVVGLEINSARI